MIENRNPIGTPKNKAIEYFDIIGHKSPPQHLQIILQTQNNQLSDAFKSNFTNMLLKTIALFTILLNFIICPILQ